MLQQLHYGFWEYWQFYHKVTFDGPNRLIIFNPGETTIDVQRDIYSAWKEWAQYETNAKYPQALRTTGGDPLNPDASLKTGAYFFLLNGWKIVVPEDFRLLAGIEIEGNLFSEDGSDIFTIRGEELLVRQIVSQISTLQTLPVTASVNVTASISADSVISASLTASYVENVGSVGTASYVQTIGDAVTIAPSQSILTASYVDTIGSPVTLEAGQTVSTASYVQTVLTASYVDSPVTLQQGQQVTASLAPNTVVTASLTPTQETMLLEIYELLGLDPTKPLVVTPDARTVDTSISQSIVKTGDQVTVTRS